MVSRKNKRNNTRIKQERKEVPHRDNTNKHIMWGKEKFTEKVKKRVCIWIYKLLQSLSNKKRIENIR